MRIVKYIFGLIEPILRGAWLGSFFFHAHTLFERERNAISHCDKYNLEFGAVFFFSSAVLPLCINLESEKKSLYNSLNK